MDFGAKVELKEEAQQAYKQSPFQEDVAADSVASQLRDAGIKVKRTILPGATFWNDWISSSLVHPFCT